MANIEKLPVDFFKDGITPLNGETLNGSLVAKINEIIESLSEQKYFNDSAVRYIKNTSNLSRSCVLFSVENQSNFNVVLTNNSSDIKFAIQYITQENWDIMKNGSTDPSNPMSSVAVIKDTGWINPGSTDNMDPSKGARGGYGVLIVATYVNSSTGTPTANEMREAIELELVNVTSI